MERTIEALPIATVRKAFDALNQVFYSETHNWAERLLAECCNEERSHRGFSCDFAQHHTSDTIGVKDAARMFAVKRVAEYLHDDPPAVKDYLHMQKSCFTAAAVAVEFKAKIVEAWSEFDLEALKALDYCAYVKVK